MITGELNELHAMDTDKGNFVLLDASSFSVNSRVSRTEALTSSSGHTDLPSSGMYLAYITGHCKEAASLPSRAGRWSSTTTSSRRLLLLTVFLSGKQIGPFQEHQFIQEKEIKYKM